MTTILIWACCELACGVVVVPVDGRCPMVPVAKRFFSRLIRRNAFKITLAQILKKIAERLRAHRERSVA